MRRKGSAIIIAFFLMAAVSGVAFAIARLFYLDTQASGIYENSTIAYYAAESGIEEGLLRYRYDKQYELPIVDNSKFQRMNITNPTEPILVDPVNMLVPTIGDRIYDLNVTNKTSFYGNDVDGGGFLNDADIIREDYLSGENKIYHIPRDESVKIDITDIIERNSDIKILLMMSNTINNSSSGSETGTWKVCGAGGASYNGRYNENGIYNGKPAYMQEGGGKWLYWNIYYDSWVLFYIQDNGWPPMADYYGTGLYLPANPWLGYDVPGENPTLIAGDGLCPSETPDTTSTKNSFVETKLTGQTAGSVFQEYKKVMVTEENTLDFPSTSTIMLSKSSDVYSKVNLISNISGNTLTNSQGVELSLKPINCDITIALVPADGRGMVSPWTTVKSIGYYGNVSRTLEAKVDRQSGTVYDLFDFVTYQHE